MRGGFDGNAPAFIRLSALCTPRKVSHGLKWRQPTRPLVLAAAHTRSHHRHRHRSRCPFLRATGSLKIRARIIIWQTVFHTGLERTSGSAFYFHFSLFCTCANFSFAPHRSSEKYPPIY